MTDGCGGMLFCGNCQTPQSCGGGGTPSVCGTPAGCTGLCPFQQVTCNPGVVTKITGTVYDPIGMLPLPNAIVYVPNGAVQPFSAGVSCDNCAVASGSPLVSTTTAVDGTFTINNMPATTNVPLVIQIGRWRRQFTIPNVPACQTTNLNTVLAGAYGSPPLRFPRNKAEGDIPRIALSTGGVDTMECVLRKMGISDSEFTLPSGPGRVNFYGGGYYPGAYVGNGWGGAGGMPWEDALVGSTAELDKYDMVLFPCQGVQFYYGNQVPYENLIAQYANGGGRVFATHYSDMWITTYYGVYSSPLSSAINWNLNQNAWNGSQTGYINTGFARGSLLAQWLQIVGASSTFGQIPVAVTRQDYDGVAANSVNWLDVHSPTTGVHATFDTPLGVPATSQCGRVVFSDFHVEDSSLNNAQQKFPRECDNASMTPQEKLLEYMLFDLASCVGATPPPPVCTKTTCAAQGVTCGQTGDGCGGTLTCGAACAPPPCVPTTCAAQSLSCGQAGDGCGGTLNCGTCTAPNTCGGGGTPGQCGTKATCTPSTCAAQSLSCGQSSDGCGTTLNCGTCTAPDICGGSGTPGQCGHATIFNDATFVRTYDTSGCPAGTQPTWGLWSWNSSTPADSHIDFTVQTAATLAGLASAPSDPVKFSNPPGPAALAGQVCSAHAANQPVGSPDTEVGSADINTTLAGASRFPHYPFLRVTSHLAPSANKTQGPLLISWNLEVSCQPGT